MVALNFNASQVKPNVALDAIPSGIYPVMITSSVEKPTKNGAGSYIELEMTIQGGDFANRKVFDRLNIKNQNQQAVDIAYSTLSAICHVTGRLDITATEQLHGIPFMAVVNKRVRDDLPPPAPGEQPQYSNEVKGYKDIRGNDPGHAGNTQGGGAATPQWANGQQPQQVQQQPQFQPQQTFQQPQQQQPQQPQQQNVQQQPQNGQQNYQQPQQPQQQQPQQQVQPQQNNGAPPPWAQ